MSSPGAGHTSGPGALRLTIGTSMKGWRLSAMACTSARFPVFMGLWWESCQGDTVTLVTHANQEVCVGTPRAARGGGGDGAGLAARRSARPV